LCGNNIRVKRNLVGNMRSARVLVVEDYEPFRRYICATLGKNPDFWIVAEVSDGLQAVREAEALQPDLILLDIGLPGLDGIEAARRIRRLSPASKILFVTQESSLDVIEEALSLGALGYVIKAHASTELIVAVETVCAGGQYVSNGDYRATQP
jgi:DNA-binding NarL/FixJ family response regulator